MRNVLILLVLTVFGSCQKNTEKSKKPISSIEVTTVFEDSISIRTLEVLNDGTVAFAGSGGKFGSYDPNGGKVQVAVQKYDSLTPSFRATAHTDSDFFMLSIESPSLLYKTGDDGRMQLVYKESDSLAFYDAMQFWDNQEGIAFGDPTSDCMSLIITRNGGKSWQKVPCDLLPKVHQGEAAFAASNGNIVTKGDKAWLLSGGMISRVYYTTDRGKSWEVFETSLIAGKNTTGGYAMDFYDENLGIIVGGDYSDPDGNVDNKAITRDGGKTWELIASGQQPDYKSSVQFVPEGNGQEIIALGFTGIDYSQDGGASWSSLSDEPFYTFRMVNDSLAYAAGNNRLARLKFSR
ncbi:MAG: oxidoreductase [Leeuwenhoekiella sp.]